LKTGDGSYVWVEQLDNKRLTIGQRLDGHTDSVGTERLTDPESGEVFDFFVQAYGLEAVNGELRE